MFKEYLKEMFGPYTMLYILMCMPVFMVAHEVFAIGTWEGVTLAVLIALLMGSKLEEANKEYWEEKQ